jgi:L-asparaginase II
MLLVSKYLRGNTVDNFHIGCAVAVDERGDLIFAAGEPDYPIFIRSAAKPFQAAAILEAKAPEKFNLNEEELAIICASHIGEAHHIDTVSNILKKIGIPLDQLACNVQHPLDRSSYEQLILRGGRPSKLHNTCSGEHAGMLAMAKALDFDPNDYFQANHPVQLKIYEKIKLYAQFDKMPTAADNCGAPTYFMPLRNLALMYKKLVNAEDEYLRRVYHVLTLHPRMIAGRNQLDTDLTQLLSGRGVAKSGSEGVRAIGIRNDEGKAIGIAIKVQSGNMEACDSMTLTVLKYLQLIDDETLKKLENYHAPTVKGANEIEISKLQTELIEQ